MLFKHKYNVGISDSEFIEKINKDHFYFFNKVDDAIKQNHLLYLHLYEKQKFGRYRTFVIKVSDENNNQLFITQFFNTTTSIIEYRCHTFLIENIEMQISIMKSKYKELNNNQYISNLHRYNGKIATEFEKLEKSLARAKNEYENALPMSEKQQIKKIFSIISKDHHELTLRQTEGKLTIWELKPNNNTVRKHS